MTNNRSRRGSSLTSESQLLFRAEGLRLECWLEVLPPLISWARRKPQGWEEVYLLQGTLSNEAAALEQLYLCLPPSHPAAELVAGDASARLLRLNYDGRSEDFEASGKPSVEVKNLQGVHWNEIPARRPGDPGGRVAELATDPRRLRITSLMDCRPGWILDEHDHPADVLTYCIRGGGRLGIGQETHAYEAGHLVVIPAGTRHSFATGKDGALLIVFTFEASIGHPAGLFRSEERDHANHSMFDS